MPHVEIDAWARLMRLDISPSEVEALRQLDIAFRNYQHEKDHPPQRSFAEQMAELKKAQEEMKGQRRGR